MKRKIPKRLMLILDEAKKALRKIYGSRLRGIVLYGSHARGEAVAGSDIDLLVLLQNMSDPVAELEKLSKRIRQIDFKYDTLISIVPMDAKEYETRKLPLILNARREGVAV